MPNLNDRNRRTTYGHDLMHDSDSYQVVVDSSEPVELAPESRSERRILYARNISGYIGTAADCFITFGRITDAHPNTGIPLGPGSVFPLEGDEKYSGPIFVSTLSPTPVTISVNLRQ